MDVGNNNNNNNNISNFILIEKLLTSPSNE